MASKAEIKIEVARCDKIEQVWRDAEQFITMGIKADTRTIGCVITEIFIGDEKLWTISVNGKTCAAFVTRVCRDDSGKRYVGMSNLGGFGARLWIAELIEALTTFARENGCASVRCYGRKAWTRIFPRECTVIGRYDNKTLHFERAVS